MMGAVRLSHQPWFFLTGLLGGLDFVGGVKTAVGKSVNLNLIINGGSP
jgi:hypothetical protein